MWRQVGSVASEITVSRQGVTNIIIVGEPAVDTAFVIYVFMHAAKVLLAIR
jgi:hypothetical protein